MQFYNKRRRIPMINVVSLIDVFCLLLIFFVVTTTFKKVEPRIAIKVPESSTAQKTPQVAEPVIIYATKAEEIYIGNDKISLSGLTAELKSRKDQARAGFALKADTDVPLGFFVKVLDASKEAGITDLSMFTTDPRQNQMASPAGPR